MHVVLLSGTFGLRGMRNSNVVTILAKMNPFVIISVLYLPCLVDLSFNSDRNGHNIVVATTEAGDSKTVISNGANNHDIKTPAKDKHKKLPKDPLYITDVDIENLYDQWEDSDEDVLPPDELPPHKRPPPKSHITDDLLQDDLLKDPEKLMRASKKGKTVMAFVTVANNPSKEETEILTQRWQVGLTNNHMKCERFVISDDRAIFVFEDGSLAFEAKDFLTSQPELKEYTIDNRSWHGKGYPVEHPHASESTSRSDL